MFVVVPASNNFLGLFLNRCFSNNSAQHLRKIENLPKLYVNSNLSVNTVFYITWSIF